MPVYNRGKELEKALRSILNQTETNYELIIVNDGSTDNTKEIIDSFRDEFGHLLSYHEQKNQGPQKARNNGAQYAHGEYLLFCDGDIIMKPSMLREMKEALQKNPQASYAYSNFIWVKKKFRLEPFNAEKLKQMPYIHTCSLIRKENFPGFDENIKRFQDWDLWLTMLKAGHSGVWIDKFLFQKQSGATMSSWLPSFAYKILPFLPKVRNYKKAMKIIKNKHNL
jgi:glycosyltransferase involved in cell wall biosynthesis